MMMSRQAVDAFHKYSYYGKKTVRNLSTLSKAAKASEEITADENRTVRKNAMNIQMLFPSLHKQIFKNQVSQEESTDVNFDTKVEKSINSLKTHGLWGKDSPPLPPVDFKLPDLYGDNIDDHFRTIANRQCSKYIDIGERLVKSQIPAMPKSWALQTGWTKYNVDGSWQAVDFPDEDAMVFDVEVLVTESPLPIMASAVSSSAWYSWCSGRLVEDRLAVSHNFSLNDLISLETKAGQLRPPKIWKEKLIIGHNVSYDRARIKEQYYVKGTKTRFVDTMSLHIATSGLTGLQRALLIADLTGSKRKDAVEAKAKARGPPVKAWMNVGSLNNLSDVHKLHCGGNGLKKDEVEVFIKGRLCDVQKDFQKLMTYCANDVQATFEIIQVLWPLFFQRFPHPVTFAGMLEMSVAYLPVNSNWQKYLDNAQMTFNDLESELKLMLMRLANDACELQHEDAYKKDTWLWDLDWEVKEMKTKKIPLKTKTKKAVKKQTISDAQKSTISPTTVTDENVVAQNSESSVVQATLQTASNLYAIQPNLPGYPAWFRDLCPKLNDDADEEWNPGPTLISSQMQIVPKLLRLTWEGYPLHFSKKNRWGYLVPGKPVVNSLDENLNRFPYKSIRCENGKIFFDSKVEISSNKSEESHQANLDQIWERILDGSADVSEDSELWNLFMSESENRRSKKVNARAGSESGSPNHHGNGPYLDEDIPGCWFYRLPHKDGPDNKVGNPLAKDFINKIEDGTLRSSAGENADWALKLSKMISYWKNAHKRITSQMVVWLRKGELPKLVVDSGNFEEDKSYGSILPVIVTAGTVTRRAVEATWMTASNAYLDRVGSELKSMVQAFPGYRFVGADVDSQELWIAAILGDAHSAGLHGCTPFGWMTLQGKKSQETDMHSLTANTAGITRDQAKVMNYGRIYGAGEAFASRLLMQFNHRLTMEEAKSRAQKMYATTKGVRGYVLNDVGEELYHSLTSQDTEMAYQPQNDSIVLTRKNVNFLLRESQCGLTLQDVTKGSVWMNGTESAMFNKLEAIALSNEPKTPVLGCQISRALEPSSVMDNFVTSRVNWVVQSSAVDYLHLMLVSMRWLFDQYDIEGRFSISIHDEVRYLVKTEDSYRAALALQITNLLTRSMFGYKLGMYDLPQSVAFFSSVDIDTVLRKEVHLDCKTPSNHLGLQSGYGIPPGESLDIYTILKLAKGTLEKGHSSKQ